jgi:beta-xylosidase
MKPFANPVYPFYFADPFVWKHDNAYFAVGTGPVQPQATAPAEGFSPLSTSQGLRAFPLLTSQDLQTWTSLGGALDVPDWARHGEFWAPEVAFDGNQFYLYFSVSLSGLNHRLRLATSPTPQGPFQDAGALMPDDDSCPFAIDAHPFQDRDGQWYLFYARDFLDANRGFRAGTALVADRLENMTRLAGKPVTVLRARSDWQRFRANREMYGRIFDWHTLEGPCVRFHDGRYYCFYSGGCYENDSYGVDYGVSDHVLGPYSDEGNESGPRVMKTIPGRMIGPGHQSIAIAPDGVECFVYHAWDPEMTARRMRIDPLVWTSQGPRCEMGQPVTQRT